jgi:hypothetical protein
MGIGGRMAICGILRRSYRETHEDLMATDEEPVANTWRTRGEQVRNTWQTDGQCGKVHLRNIFL